MNEKIRGGTFEMLFVFIMSPFIAIPIILVQLKRGSEKYTYILIALLMGLLSFRYIPTITNDKVEYFKRYSSFRFYDFSEFWQYLTKIKKPDFLFDTVIFLFSKAQIDFNYFFLILTSFTVFSIVKFVVRCLNEYSIEVEKLKINLLFLILVSFALTSLFSQVRFYLAASIFIWCVYYLLIKRNLLLGVVLFLLTISIHFSFAFFIPPLLILFMFENRLNYKVFLAVSLIFYIMPKTFFSSILQLLNLPESYDTKIDVYMSREVQLSFGAVVFNFLKNLWVYLACVFFLFVKHENTRLLNIVILLLAFTNIASADPFIFGRYSIVVALFFIAYLYHIRRTNEIKPIYYKTFIFLFILAFAVNLNIMRFNILASYSWNDLLTIVNIFSHHISPNEFLR